MCLQVKQFQDLRAKLPESTTLLVMKNSLLEKAIDGTPFEALKPSMTGMNAFLFVHSEEIPPALKPFRYEHSWGIPGPISLLSRCKTPRVYPQCTGACVESLKPSMKAGVGLRGG